MTPSEIIWTLFIKDRLTDKNSSTIFDKDKPKLNPKSFKPDEFVNLIEDLKAKIKLH